MMLISSAQARTTELLVIPRASAKEAQPLRQIATWLSQFTPMNCLEAAGTSLEVSASPRLFGGIGSLANRVRTGIGALQFHATLGIAPTPLAACLFAEASYHASSVRVCRDATQIKERLADVSLALFAWPYEILQPFNA
ncbi:MAG: hypothetical protein H7232_00425 [Aeromicrobium sp.]|nr:hypothetical protein [Burkholderiales bacterium]